MSEIIQLSFDDGSSGSGIDISECLIYLVIALVLGYVVKSMFFDKDGEGFSLQIPKFTPETERIPKLASNNASKSEYSPDYSSSPPEVSPEQQSAILEQQVMSEYDDLNRSLMGGAVSLRDDHFLVDDGALNDFLVHNMKCSKSCCGQQWSVPHDTRKDPSVCKIGGEEYIPTNLNCANEYSSGCCCIPKRAWKFLAAKGGNGTFSSPYKQLLI